MSYPIRILGQSTAVLMWATLSGGIAFAQSGTAAGISPVAPPTLKSPVFDTTTPVYGPKNIKQRAKTVVAEVDGRAVTLGDIADAIKDLPPTMQQLRYDVLFPIVQDQLIGRQALVIKAEHQGLDADAAVRRQMKAAADKVLVNELLEREASHAISEKDLLERYARDVADKPGPDEAHLRVILVPTEAAARDIIKELQAGADFATLAKRSSQDTTASVGGDLGFVTRAAVNPELSGVAFSLAPGQVAPAPISSNGSWFVLKVEERRKQPTPPFSVVRTQLEQAIAHERVPELTKAAVAEVNVRIFNVSGQEVEDLPEDKVAKKAN